MSWLTAVILGAVQGATEFLPISSSGHLVIFSRLRGCAELPLAFVVITHFGTLLAVVAYYRSDFADMIRSLAVWSSADPEQHQQLHQSRRLVGLLVLGTIPAALAGMLLEDYVAQLFNSLLVVGIALVITGLILLAVNWLSGRKERDSTTLVDALLIGVAQAVALVPGISRSGCTIAAGLGRGLHRDWAPRFAFLLSAPVILGGTVFEAIRLVQNPISSQQLGIYLLGGLVAAVAGYFAVHLVVKAVRQGNLIYFSAYCIVVGIATALVGGLTPS